MYFYDKLKYLRRGDFMFQFSKVNEIFLKISKDKNLKAEFAKLFDKSEMEIFEFCKKIDNTLTFGEFLDFARELDQEVKEQIKLERVSDGSKNNIFKKGLKRSAAVVMAGLTAVPAVTPNSVLAKGFVDDKLKPMATKVVKFFKTNEGIVTGAAIVTAATVISGNAYVKHKDAKKHAHNEKIIKGIIDKIDSAKKLEELKAIEKKFEELKSFGFEFKGDEKEKIDKYIKLKYYKFLEMASKDKLSRGKTANVESSENIILQPENNTNNNYSNKKNESDNKQIINKNIIFNKNNENLNSKQQNKSVKIYNSKSAGNKSKLIQNSLKNSGNSINSNINISESVAVSGSAAPSIPTAPAVGIKINNTKASAPQTQNNGGNKKVNFTEKDLLSEIRQNNFNLRHVELGANAQGNGQSAVANVQGNGQGIGGASSNVDEGNKENKKEGTKIVIGVPTAPPIPVAPQLSLADFNALKISNAIQNKNTSTNNSAAPTNLSEILKNKKAALKKPDNNGSKKEGDGKNKKNIGGGNLISDLSESPLFQKQMKRNTEEEKNENESKINLQSGKFNDEKKKKEDDEDNDKPLTKAKMLELASQIGGDAYAKEREAIKEQRRTEIDEFRGKDDYVVKGIATGQKNENISKENKILQPSNNISVAMAKSGASGSSAVEKLTLEARKDLKDKLDSLYRATHGNYDEDSDSEDD